MVKVVIRELIIALLACAALLLAVVTVFYNFIPANKTLPEVTKYKAAEDIQVQLNEEVDEESDEIILTYEVTAQDLDNYEKIDEYNPGKVNPFAPAPEKTEETGESSNNTSTGATTGNTTSGNTATAGGELFENSTSK